MKDKLENVSKLIPALTLLCYISGFVIYNTHLWHYGIIDVELFNLRYIVAGLNFTFFTLFIFGTAYLWPLHLYTSLFKRLLWVSVNASISFTFYFIFFYPTDTTLQVLPSYLLVVFMTNLAYICIESIKQKGIHLSDIPLWVFSLVISSLFIFGLTYKHIKKNVGGGQLYKKILILEKPINGFLSVNKSLMTDTLFIIHENEKEIFFYNIGKVCSLKKSLILGEIMIKD